MNVTLISVLVAIASAQGFQFKQLTDQMTDQDRSFVVTTNEDSTATLAWQCREDGLQVLYRFETYAIGEVLGGWRVVSIQHRFPPAHAAPPRRWLLLPGQKAAVTPRPEDMTAFTRQALAFPRVIMRVLDTDGDVVTHEFSLGGLSDALQNLSCAKPLLAGLKLGAQ